ncbi:MAG: redox-sensing transcriptional repressor Rex [Planctomycetes bacterium]|nr:redox-sensing transcriptional repressor Rex [Planctomycetota bacterium]
MMRYHKVPEETIKRMPQYLRALLFLRQQSTKYITSRGLSEYVLLNPPQIRKDLSYFGAFGLRGTGYEVEPLIKQIRRILKLDVEQKTVLVGAGRLGSAIARFPGFQRYGFNITDIYDNAGKRIGKKIGKIQIKDVAKLNKIKANSVKIAIIATPPETAQQIADALVKAGVTSILNLTSAYLAVPKKVRVRTVDLAMELGMLPYYT